jgi:hypothetical protein
MGVFKMSDYTYSYDSDTNHFMLFVDDRLVYDMSYCDPMTDNEAEELALELFIDYKENL